MFLFLFLSVSVSLFFQRQVFSSYLGESERVLRDAFHRARRNAPCVLFIDEIDALTGARGLDASAGVGTCLDNYHIIVAACWFMLSVMTARAVNRQNRRPHRRPWSRCFGRACGLTFLSSK